MTDLRVIPAMIVVATLALVAACGVADAPGGDGPTPSETRPAERFLEPAETPYSLSLPEDASPHDRLTEWWYYTGHLEDEDGHLYGFQFVIFQAQRGDFPPLYAAHFAVTDTSAGTFQFSERSDSFIYQPGEAPFDLNVDGWRLTGGDGLDRIEASLNGYELEVQLVSEKEPVLHEGDGYFEFAPGAESYYYSRTRMSADGTLIVDGQARTVTGSAWFDQQWGDFLVLDNVGWDWFSVQLDNGEELMAWRSHDRAGNTLDGNATIIRRDGTALDVPFDQLEIDAMSEWTSPATGAVYPLGWTISIESEAIELEIDPVMEDQELITLETTGVIYWEGMVTVAGNWKSVEVEGLGYVELTGYADESQYE